MQELLEYIVKSLVDNPDEVSISSKQLENGAVEYLIKVSDSDKGLIIGKRGTTINAIRSIIKIKAIKEKVFVKITLEDDKRNDEKEVETSADRKTVE